MKKIEENSNLKSFIEISPEYSNNSVKNYCSLSSVLFPRKINLEKNDYFKDFDLKKNNKFVGSFLSSNEETNQSLNSQKRINSEIYERLKNEEENFIKTLLRLKEKMNNNNNNSKIEIPKNLNLSTKNIYKKINFPKEILPNRNENNKNQKIIKIIPYKKKINLVDNKKNLSSNSFQIKLSNSQNKTKKIINIKQILKTRTISELNDKNKNKNKKNNKLNDKKNISTYVIKKKNNFENKVERKLNSFSKEKKNKKIIPIAYINLFDESKRKIKEKRNIIKKNN